MKDNNKLFGSLKRLKIKESSSNLEETVNEESLGIIDAQENNLFKENTSFEDETSEQENFDDIMDIINEDIPLSENSDKEYIEREEALKYEELSEESTIEEFKESENRIIEESIFEEDTVTKENNIENILFEEQENDLDNTSLENPMEEDLSLESEIILEKETIPKENNEFEFSEPYIGADFSLDEEQETENPFIDEELELSKEEIEEPFEDSPEFTPEENNTQPEFVYSEENEMDEGEVYNGYYNENEISSKRTKVKKKPKDLALKVLIGGIMVVILVGLAFGGKYLINNWNNIFSKEEVTNTEESETIEIPSEITETTTPTQIPESLENEPIEESSGIDVSNEIKEEQDKTPQKEEVSSFIQTFTGYVVDINNTDIYVSDKMTDEQLDLLSNDFDTYMTGTDTTVYIEDSTQNNSIEETDSNTTEETDIIIIGAPSNDSNSEENKEKVYHSSPTCEFSMSIDLSPVKLSSLSEDYEMCESCGNEISLSSNTVLDYDYSEIPELASIIYKKFNVDAETIPDWTTIGSKITISYMQNADTYLNDIIEISRAKTNTDLDTNFEIDANGNVVETESEDDYRLSETNIFGAEFEPIIAKINDRNKGKQEFTGNILDEELELTGTGTRESVTSNINIGSCDYVWIQIVWKKNKDTKTIPDVEDVTVELQTPGGSLVNDNNLNMYGTKWINKKVVNYVLKNPKVGNWKVLFTKDVGTYLGDVTIQAAPMTGFLRIDKAAAKYTDGKLKCIWQATGIADDYCKVQIYARNGNNDILLYSGNTLDDDIRTVDMVDIDTTKIAGNIYDIVIKITDIDVSASTPKSITYQFITDEYIVENVEVPAVR